MKISCKGAEESIVSKAGDSKTQKLENCRVTIFTEIS